MPTKYKTSNTLADMLYTCQVTGVFRHECPQSTRQAVSLAESLYNSQVTGVFFVTNAH